MKGPSVGQTCGARSGISGDRLVPPGEGYTLKELCTALAQG